MKFPSALGRVKSRLTYGNVIATLALFMALGGVSWAATSLPKNSVTSKSIKKNAVTGPKIKKNAVSSTKVKNRSLLGSDLKNETLTGSQINESTLTGVAAASAATADNVVSLHKIANATTADTEAAGRAAAPEIPLVSHGQVSVYGKCFFTTGTSEIWWETYVRTTADGASVQAYSSSDSQYRFGPGTDPETLQVQQDDQSSPGADDDYADDVFLIGPNNQGIAFSVFTFAQVGNPADTPGYIADKQCSFQLSGTKIG